jgi:hypothetical protein
VSVQLVLSLGAFNCALIRIESPSMPQFTSMQSCSSISTTAYVESPQLSLFRQQETHGNAAPELRLAIAQRGFRYRSQGKS